MDDSVQVNMGNVGYRVNDEMVIKKNLENGFVEQLSCGDTIETNPKKEFLFHQSDPINKKEVNMHYVLEGFGNPNIALPYLKNKRPIGLDIVTQKLLLSLTKRYILENNNTFVRYRRVNDDTVLLLPLLRKYSYKDMMSLIQSYGCNPTLPSYMTDLFLGQNEDVKTLTRVADVYRKNTNL